MSQRDFAQLLDSLKLLSPEQMVRLRAELDNELARDSGGMVEESAYEAFKRAGLIGCIEGSPDSPNDLSTNTEHMRGFGRE